VLGKCRLGYTYSGRSGADHRRTTALEHGFMRGGEDEVNLKIQD